MVNLPSDDIGHVWLLYTVDWTSMAISNGKTASTLYYNVSLTIKGCIYSPHGYY